MKLLVTGGSGFIGSNFILYWLDKYPHDRIVNMDKLTYAGNPENLESVEHDPRYTFIRGDISDRNLTEQAMREIDTVVHFAAESHVDRSIRDPSAFIQTNIVGTYILLEAALKAGVTRFHHVSTDEVFGALELGSTEKFSETTPYNPHSPYSASKASSDHLVRAYYHTYGLPVTITNCSNNFGPYQFPEKFIALTITNILEGLKVPVYGDGLYERDWLYVTDHCAAIDAVIRKGTVGRTYCVGGLTDEISNLDVIRKILAIMGADESAIQFVKDRPAHDRRYAIDWSRIHADLGWSPQSGFDEYLKRTVTWYREHRGWWQKIKTGAYRDYYRTQYGSQT